MYSYDELKEIGIHDLRNILRDEFGGIPGSVKKDGLINQILELQDSGALPVRVVRGRKPLKTAKPDEVDDTTEDNGLTFKEPVKEEPEDPGERREVGVLELNTNENYGFIRVINYDNSPRDVFVAPNYIKKFNLRNGDYISCWANKNETKAAALCYVTSINGRKPAEGRKRADFDSLVPHYPTERYTLENDANEYDLSVRCLDLFAPIGKGQRGLIVAPPKAGKTTLLKKIANAIKANYPDVTLITLLIDERPEEVTDIKTDVGGEVVSSTFDESSEHHIKIAELVLSRAKRLVEEGDDVIILLDSITRLARAYNAVSPASGRTMTGGIETGALQAPKKFLGAARNIVGGGSLTIVATVLVDTGSRMDEVIYEEFKGTGNMELHLSRELAERRIFPAIDLYRSGTRKDEFLLSDEEILCADNIRKILADDRNASANMLEMMSKTSDNAAFVKRVPSWLKMAFNK